MTCHGITIEVDSVTISMPHGRSVGVAIDRPTPNQLIGVLSEAMVVVASCSHPSREIGDLVRAFADVVRTNGALSELVESEVNHAAGTAPRVAIIPIQSEQDTINVTISADCACDPFTIVAESICWVAGAAGLEVRLLPNLLNDIAKLVDKCLVGVVTLPPGTTMVKGGDA